MSLEVRRRADFRPHARVIAETGAGARMLHRAAAVSGQ